MLHPGGPEILESVCGIPGICGEYGGSWRSALDGVIQGLHWLKMEAECEPVSLEVQEKVKLGKWKEVG